MNGYIVAFDSTQQAIRAEMLFEFADIEIDTQPTPKEITAGCALSIGFEAKDLERIRLIIEEEKVEIRGIYIKSKNRYVNTEEV